jgi:hypothetical protein
MRIASLLSTGQMKNRRPGQDLDMATVMQFNCSSSMNGCCFVKKRKGVQNLGDQLSIIFDVEEDARDQWNAGTAGEIASIILEICNDSP